MNPPPSEITTHLRRHLDLCQEVLLVIEQEGQALRQDPVPSLAELQKSKKGLLPRLNESLDAIRQQRVQWQAASPAERARHTEAPALLQRTPDLGMKIIVMDRENEQALLRRGMLPARELPPVNRQRPHYVAGLYQRARA